MGYSAVELGALGPAQQGTLADLTALGLAVADGRLDEVAEPFVERELRSLVLQRLAMEVAVDQAGMEESELREAYAADPEPELVVRHLVVLAERWRPEEYRDSARAVAREALRRARAGEPFEELVKEYSDEPGARERGGRLQPGREGSWVPEFWRAASSLKEGEISDVVETEYGFHIIQLVERRAVPFEEVRQSVLTRFVDLPQALEGVGAWATSQAGRARIDTAAVMAWARGDTVTGPLVRWPEESGHDPYRAEQLDRLLSTYSAENALAVRRGDTAAMLQFVESTARNEVLLDRAAGMGLEASASQRAALERRWDERLGGWAETLGFEPGASTGSIKALALAGLGSQQQAVAIARSEIPTIAQVLRQLYPVRLPSPDGGSPD